MRLRGRSGTGFAAHVTEEPMPTFVPLCILALRAEKVRRHGTYAR